MNFIHHYRGWLKRVGDDDRLTPHHVSLYLALFESWNVNRFQNPMTIYRSEIMRLSRIGSKTTYLRCLKELSEWGYIRYNPSFDPQQGSQVYLYRFDTRGEPATGTAGGTGPGTTDGTGGGTAPGTIYKTIPNSKNVINVKNKTNAYGTIHENSVSVNGGEPHTHSQTHSSSNARKKRTEGGRPTGRAVPGSTEEAKAYFLEIQSTAAEAEKFFNHFQSTGWKIGGRSAMKDWRAAARNWVINAKKFAHEHTNQPKPGKLNTGRKNYSEPL